MCGSKYAELSSTPPRVVGYSQPILTFTRPVPLLTLFVGLKLILAPTCYRVAIMASASIRRRARPRHPSGPPRAHKTAPSRPRRPRRPTSKGNPQGPKKRKVRYSAEAAVSERSREAANRLGGRRKGSHLHTHTMAEWDEGTKSTVQRIPLLKVRSPASAPRIPPGSRARASRRKTAPEPI